MKDILVALEPNYGKVEGMEVLERSGFSPDLIKELSEKWNIPTNLMFIGSPGNHFMYGLKDLGGVRLVI